MKFILDKVGSCTCLSHWDVLMLDVFRVPHSAQKPSQVTYECTTMVVSIRYLVTSCLQALQKSEREVNSLQLELAECKQKGTWRPGAAAFQALEWKINNLRMVPPTQQHSTQQLPMTAVEMQSVVQHYERLLAAKNTELEGFRSQVDALLTSARQVYTSSANRLVGTSLCT